MSPRKRLSTEPTERNFHTELQKLQTHVDCPGMSWKLKNINGDGDFDMEMLPLLMALNNERWHTVASCAGHTLKDIKREKKGYLVETPYRMLIFIHVSIGHWGSFARMVEEMGKAAGDRLWCELGYDSFDYSNEVEKGFLPFKINVFAHSKVNRDKYLTRFLAIAKKYSQ